MTGLHGDNDHLKNAQRRHAFVPSPVVHFEQNMALNFCPHPSQRLQSQGGGLQDYCLFTGRRYQGNTINIREPKSHHTIALQMGSWIDIGKQLTTCATNFKAFNPRGHPRGLLNPSDSLNTPLILILGHLTTKFRADCFPTAP